jgi:t-SNARE complex subunit (syntaxin)
MSTHNNKKKTNSNTNSNDVFNVLHNTNEITQENTKFISNQQIEFKKQLRQQDDALDQLEKGIDRLGQTAKAINDETKLQEIMLDNLDKDISNSNNKIGKTNEILGKFLKIKDNCSSLWIIITLIVLLIILVCLVIWT